MKEYLRKAALAVFLVLTLSGCGGAGGAEPGASAQPPEAGTGSDRAVETIAAAPETEPERPEVENNGGFFVRVGDRVWFRYYGEDAMDEPQLWGEFLSAWPSHGGASTLCFYDITGDAIMEAVPDDGFGRLWYGLDAFYLTRVSGTGARTVYRLSPETGETRELCPGEAAGMSENGRYLAVRSERGGLLVYEGEEEKSGVEAADGQYLEYAALTADGSLLYCLHDAAGGSHSLRQLTAEGGSLVLGELPAGDFGLYAPELEQCLLHGGAAYFVFGWYEGTGHFLARDACLRAEPGKANSLTELDVGESVEAEGDGEPPLPRLYVRPEGEVAAAAHAPGELALSAEGDLLRYDGAAKAQVQLRGLLRGGDDEDEVLQCAETISGAVYLIVADVHRAEEADIGWRLAYAPDIFYYLRSPLGTDSWVETLYGDTWISTPDPETLYAGYVGKWRMVDSEVEGARGGPPPEGSEYTIEFLPDGSAAVLQRDGSEVSYQNTFGHMETMPSGDGGFGLLFTAEGNEDMLYAFFEGETLAATVQMFYTTEYGSEAISATGYYTR